MSVTVFIRGKHGVRRYEPGKRWMLLPAVVVCAGLTLWWQAKSDASQVEGQLAVASASTAQHQNEISALREQTEAQLSLLAARLGRMQARMNRIESVGMAVADRVELADQFDFQSEVGLGGGNVPSEQGVELGLLLEQMDQMLLRLERSDNQLALLETLERHHHIDNDSYLSGRPLLKGWQSSSFGYRNDPFNGRRTLHRGLDFAGPEGGEVIATGAGVVSYSGTMFGYGNLVEIDHGNGIKTRYGHNKENLVELGQVVAKGDTVALIGSTGRSTGPHVHYEVMLNDQQVDPARYVYRKPRS
ncbi:M23 family metallopeptidase [Ferrimonas balearica]|uniref:M23 family metallopeptidase n=1 Tax=Ferrimonas balearica TaxID=44012 RepID=UPI001C9A2A3A|nr:M23 family metallopeptidase [Ferrimonas balearica]MBY5992128.1 peptidoglycan DD-metalloendopeptidase family protein [Ferrimonas balearica]